MYTQWHHPLDYIPFMHTRTLSMQTVLEHRIDEVKMLPPLEICNSNTLRLSREIFFSHFQSVCSCLVPERLRLTGTAGWPLRSWWLGAWHPNAWPRNEIWGIIVIWDWHSSTCLTYSSCMKVLGMMATGIGYPDITRIPSPLTLAAMGTVVRYQRIWYPWVQYFLPVSRFMAWKWLIIMLRLIKRNGRGIRETVMSRVLEWARKQILFMVFMHMQS